MKTTVNKLTLALVIVLSFTVTKAQKPYKLPVYEKFSLSNGLTIYLMEQHEVPTITVSAIIPAGAIYDNGKPGLAALTAAGLQYGTKSYTKSRIEAELDFVGATLNTYASKEYAGLSAEFAAKDQDKVLPIIKEILVDPVFDAKEFEKEKKRVLTNLEQAKESPRSVISGYWDKLIFGNHVYGNSLTGSPLTVGELTIGDLKDFYKTNYKVQASAIAVTGDFNVKQMRSSLTKLFKAWKADGLSRQNLASVPVAVPASSRVLLVDKADARETTFFVGGLGISRNNPDYVAIDVVNTVFGGRFTSMLNDELRVNSGLTYGANSRFMPLKNSGTFAISTFTATNTTEAAINKVLEVLHRLHKEGIDEETLTSAKNYVKGQFPPRYETSSQLAGLLTAMFWYGFDESYINNFQSAVNSVTGEKAKEIIDKYFPKDRLQYVLIGKSDDIRPIAEKLGTITEKEIKADGF